MSETNIGYIYITTNKVNGKKYIGQHRSKVFDKNYKGSGHVLLKAFDKYGRGSFHVEILEWCNSLEKLNEKEIYWIDKFNAVYDPNFYNISLGGGGWLMTDEQKKHNSETQKIVQMKDDVREKKRKALLGRPLSDDLKKKLSIIQKEVQNRPEVLEANRRKQLGNTNACKKVMCIETGIIFSSCLKAAQSLGKDSHSSVARCAREYHKGNKSVKVYGYHWCYPDDYHEGELALC